MILCCFSFAANAARRPLRFRFLNRPKRAECLLRPTTSPEFPSDAFVYRYEEKFNFTQVSMLMICDQCCTHHASSGSRGALEARGPACPQDFFKITQLQAILRENPILSKFWAQGLLPWGQNSAGPPPDQNPGSAPARPLLLLHKSFPGSTVESACGLQMKLGKCG